MSEIVLGYIPCKNKKEAEKIANALVEKRLVACANIIPAISSCYKWEGKTVNETESLLLVKTIKTKKKLVSEQVKKLHSYRLPCIAFIKFDEINKEYELWVKQRSY
ncbi:MAG: divalent-cation tolerance protein CutA [archaeon]